MTGRSRERADCDWPAVDGALDTRNAAVRPRCLRYVDAGTGSPVLVHGEGANSESVRVEDAPKPLAHNAEYG